MNQDCEQRGVRFSNLKVNSPLALQVRSWLHTLQAMPACSKYMKALKIKTHKSRNSNYLTVKAFS